MLTQRRLSPYRAACDLLVTTFMKFIYTLLAFLATFPVMAQTIKGTISSPDKQPIGNINIKLENTTISTLTDHDGNFTLYHVSPGTYTLLATGIGYAATTYNLIVTQGKNNFLSLILNESKLQLNEVAIGSFKSRQQDQASSFAAKLPLKNIENPQVIHTVPQMLITNQAATDLNDIIKNLPGVVKGWASTTAYYSSRGFNTRNYIRNGVPGFVTADADIANIAELVAVKGPSGTLFGSSLVSFGGLLNRITKKPFDTPHSEIGYQTGSYNLNRFTADVNTPLNKERTVLLRTIAAYHREGSFQDAGFNRSPFVSTSLFYKISDQLKVTLDAEFSTREGTSLPQIAPAGPVQPSSSKRWAEHPSALPLDYMRAYSNNSIILKSTNKSVYGQADYKLNSQWTSTTNLVRTAAGNTGNYLTFNLLRGDSLLVRNVSNYPTGTNDITMVQQNLNGDFNIGKVRNRLMIGLEFFRNYTASSSNALNGRGGRKSFDTLNVRGSMPNYSAISPEAISAKLKGLAPTYSTSTLNTYAVYASDVIDLSSRLSILLSLRADRFQHKGVTNVSTNTTTGGYAQTAFSPKLGLVYQVLPGKMVIFGNYNNGFQNVAPVNQPDGTVSAFKPQYANQLEGGIKAEPAGDRFNATISYYRIKVSNTLRPDINRQNFTIQDGTQLSEGIEMDLSSRPLNGLWLNAGFTYNNSRLLSAQPTVNGLRPVNSGPDRTANFYISYEPAIKMLQGLGAGFGGNYTGRNLIINNTVNGRFYLDSYTLFNLGLFYNHQRYRLALNVDNLTDKRYYIGGFGSITPGTLRRYITTFTLRF